MAGPRRSANPCAAARRPLRSGDSRRASSRMSAATSRWRGPICAACPPPRGRGSRRPSTCARASPSSPRRGSSPFGGCWPTIPRRSRPHAGTRSSPPSSGTAPMTSRASCSPSSTGTSTPTGRAGRGPPAPRLDTALGRRGCGLPSAPAPSDGRPVLAIVDYGHPGVHRASANIGDHIQSIASLFHVVRHAGVRLHGPRGWWASSRPCATGWNRSRSATTSTRISR